MSYVVLQRAKSGHVYAYQTTARWDAKTFIEKLKLPPITQDLVIK